MTTLIFTCKTITPLVMNGAYGNNDPELRPPGIKASLRFWWRALHGHLPLEDLRKEESKIFGSTKGRSKVIIRVVENINESQKSKYSLLPHKGGSEASSFQPNNQFKIRIDFNEKVISVEKMKNLFVLACTLGGWGKRSRRGFGSVVVTEIEKNSIKEPEFKTLETIDDIYKLLDKTYFEKANNTIYSNFRKNEPYPFLKSIEVGKNSKSLTEIGQATHETMGRNDPGKINYKYVLGAGTPRYASPIVVSVLANNLPIITTLNNVPPRITNRDLQNGASIDLDIQNDFKNRIL